MKHSSVKTQLEEHIKRGYVDSIRIPMLLHLQVISQKKQNENRTNSEKLINYKHEYTKYRAQ